MFWGQFVTTKRARGEYNCIYSQCPHQILPGEYVASLVVRNRSGVMFTRRMHEECYWPYIHEAEAAREGLIKDRRGESRPTRDFQLTAEQRRRRQTLLQYVSSDKQRLAVAYALRNLERAAKAKAALLKHLEELKAGEIGPVPKFQFGPALLELIAKGADPAISEEEARKADLESDTEYAMQLLEQESSSPPTLEQSEETVLKPVPATKFFWHKFRDKPKHFADCEGLLSLVREKFPRISDSEAEEKVRAAYNIHLADKKDWGLD